ncbi:Uncharacterized protein APZ42_011262 [Daphnia magna]|uniref:Uncharacterized protein n=1 Tax=Daphnia magna TaxID=35525 RepID=A0A162SIN3_9CRUS|nr:Uncharacterized protein APZ42_011262 [Daphnia magna]
MYSQWRHGGDAHWNFKWLHVRIDVALHVGGSVGNAVVCPSTICYVQTWNESHVTKSTKCGNNN